MLDFLRLLTPRHGNALRPASVLHRLSRPSGSEFPGSNLEEDTQAGSDDREPQWQHGDTTFAPAADQAHDEEAQRSAAPLSAHTPLANASTRSPSPAEGARAHSIHVGAATQAALASSAGEPAGVASRGRRAEWAHAAPQPSVNAPLSPTAVALHASPATKDTPIIHVSIDRIEVRAPAPATKPKTQRPLKPSTQSLADYLRGRKGMSA